MQAQSKNRNTFANNKILRNENQLQKNFQRVIIVVKEKHAQISQESEPALKNSNL